VTSSHHKHQMFKLAIKTDNDQQTVGLHDYERWPTFVNQSETWTLSCLFAEDYGVSVRVTLCVVIIKQVIKNHYQIVNNRDTELSTVTEVYDCVTETFALTTTTDSSICLFTHHACLSPAFIFSSI